MSLENKLANMGHELPKTPKPVAAYTPAVVDRGIVRTSGQLPMRDGELVSEGRCGTLAVTAERAYEAALQCALNALSAAAEAAGGLENLKRVVKVVGFVASTDDFFAQPAVINGASDFLTELFGSAHARSAVGVVALPLNATVEVEVEFELV